MSATIIIDVQGFKTEKDIFLPKELAIFDGVKLGHYVFKPPFQFHCLPESIQKEVKWLMKNHHCIKWNVGCTPLFEFRNIIQNIGKDVNVIYVKGREKANFLRRFTKVPIIELDEQPSIKFSDAKCFYHSKSLCICAVSNVYYLYDNFVKK